MKYNVWVDDCGWFIGGAMPADGSGVSLAEAKREYCELIFEYKTSSLLILPSNLEITDADEFGTLGGMYIIKEKEVTK